MLIRIFLLAGFGFNDELANGKNWRMKFLELSSGDPRLLTNHLKNIFLPSVVPSALFPPLSRIVASTVLFSFPSCFLRPPFSPLLIYLSKNGALSLIKTTFCSAALLTTFAMTRQARQHSSPSKRSFPSSTVYSCNDSSLIPYVSRFKHCQTFHVI